MSEAQPGERVEDKSLGELVALASSSVSDLIRAEMDLAKLELKADAKKAALGSVMFTIAALIGGLIVILLSIAFAYGLVAAGIWHWAAFLIVAGVYLLLALVLLAIGYFRIRKIEGAKRTRRTLKDDFTALRHRGDSGKPELTG
ncbi:phage holin family protein [Actinomadura sp. NPDC048955]|uniref:MFS family permease n=1 Tax=Actinomadura luteofluorescens TaxID=46163 RepID=A0A7Y9EIU3_9ACTN|nr:MULTISPECIES: phage holin family protein [Actinomadura]MCR3741607.1 putative Holin-X, holin superfamily III [Actinomadura glauciflava]NYD48497.1 MFS family permease [Actinomadura luteofluorescens]